MFREKIAGLFRPTERAIFGRTAAEWDDFYAIQKQIEDDFSKRIDAIVKIGGAIRLMDTTFYCVGFTMPYIHFKYKLPSGKFSDMRFHIELIEGFVKSREAFDKGMNTDLKHVNNIKFSGVANLFLECDSCEKIIHFTHVNSNKCICGGSYYIKNMENK